MNTSIRPYGRLGRTIWKALVIVCLAGSTAVAGEGMLQAIREDVRGSAPSAPATNSDETHPQDGYDDSTWANCESRADTSSETSSQSDGPDAFYSVVPLVGAVALSPILVPHNLMADDFSQNGYFLHFPYDGEPGYVKTTGSAARARPFALRLDVEYAETFSRLEEIGGHLLLETALRLGVDASLNHLEERLLGGGRDQLQIGDCNLVFRFAQDDWAEFRAGFGVNWLNDSFGTNLGFNFTHAADVYPQKPWVLSAAIDWGTLGDAGLFRFRTTGGVVLHGIETYAGYEYTDIGRTHWNSLIAGLRFWF
jgi:hypothetical protein